MVKASQRFYESTYNQENKSPTSKRFIIKLYLLLKKFEKYREDVVYGLLPSKGRLLDIGCGNGSFVIKSLAKVDFSIGMDIARTRLKYAYNKLKTLPAIDRNKVKFIVSDVDEKLPFKNNFIDTITLISVLEHLYDPFGVIDECQRILKRNGSIIIQVPNLGFFPRRMAVLLGNLPITSEDEAGWDGGHLHYFNVKSLKDLLEKYNFTVKKVTCSGIFAPFRSWWVELLGADIIIYARKN